MYGSFDIGAARKISIANYSFYKEGSLHPDRIMNEHDIVYIVNGKWEIYQNNTAHLLKAGDVIFLHAGEHHYGINPCEPNTKTMFLHINKDISDCFFYKECEEKGKYIINTVTHCQQNPQIILIFEEIINTFWTESKTKEIKLTALCQYLLCELCTCDHTPETNTITEQAVKLFHSNPHKFISSTELAKFLYVSERTVRNKFIQVYKKTPHQYQIDFKLNSVCFLLKNFPGMPLREIAANLGFCDEFHLSKSFKKMYGLSPSEYRKA